MLIHGELNRLILPYWEIISVQSFLATNVSSARLSTEHRLFIFDLLCFVQTLSHSSTNYNKDNVPKMLYNETLKLVI